MDLAKRIKYGLDRVGAVVLLVALSPLLAAIAVAIRVDSPGNPLFLQERVGEGGRTFTIFKFRTMRAGSEHAGLGASTAPADERITRVGRWLRATSLDELPQLLNIALGEMSFIGPRPTLRYQVDAYTPRQARRLLFRPGVTGWAQVHGRNGIPWERRIELDLEYVERFSLWLDLQILWRTLRTVIRREGIYATDGANDAFVSTAAADAGAPRAPAGAPRDLETQSATASAPRPAATGPTQGRRDLILVGAGGHAKVAIDVAERVGEHVIRGLLDDGKSPGTPFGGYTILGGTDALASFDPGATDVFVALGDPRARATWQGRAEAAGFRVVTLVHPAAVCARDVHLGPGCILMAGAIVQPSTCLGRGVIVNTGASIDHDGQVDDFAHLAPGARLAGNVRVGARTHVGIGASIIQGIDVGDDVVIGAGAVVVRDVPPNLTVVGVPARPLRRALPVAATPPKAPSLG